MSYRPQWTKYYDGWRYSFCCLYCIICGIIWAIASIPVLPDAVTIKYTREEILQNYGVEIKNVAHFAVLAYNGEGESKKIRWNSVECISIVFGLMTLQYSIMMISGLIMFRRTRGSSESSQHEKMQKQFFIALIYQVCLFFSH
uniref:G_PROTEIN_RECEP_F1_2 domain-containing protein n=1 Tax=Caenorhabditis tropicalis TaxID=1561998 RepID=A0A1I7U860_9PELO